MLDAGAVDDAQLGLRRFRAGVRVAEPAVPDVRVLRHQALHARLRVEGPDHDPRPALSPRTRQELHALQLVMPAVEIDQLVREQLLGYLERLLETPHPLLGRESERAVLAFRVTRAETENEPAAADVVDSHCHLGQQSRIPVARAGHE